MSEQQSGGLKEMRDRISDYHVYDRHYERVGKVDDLFVDANDELEYIGLKLGGMFTSKTALIPMELVRINDRRDLIEIEADKKQIEDSPTFGKDEEITSEYEDNVYRHFGLENPDASGERSSYGDYDESEGSREEGSREERDDDVDTGYGERAGSGHGSHEPPRTEARTESGTEDRRGDEHSPLPERERPGRDRPGAAAETGAREGSSSVGREDSSSVGREGSSSGSSGGPRIRKRLRIRDSREEAHVDRAEGGGTVPDGTAGHDESTGWRDR